MIAFLTGVLLWPSLFVVAAGVGAIALAVGRGRERNEVVVTLNLPDTGEIAVPIQRDGRHKLPRGAASVSMGERR